MKKREIVTLINLYKSINNNKQIASISDFKFPKISHLEGEIQTLINERNNRKNMFENQIQELKMLQKTCTHEVRHYYPSLFGSSRNCVICGTDVDKGSNHGIYSDCNRNSYFCEFPKDHFDGEEVFIKGVDIEKIYDYINDILKEKDEEETIDLVQEMKTMNPKKCTYIEKPYIKEYYVLIIGGSNKIYIDDSHYITKNNDNISIDLTHYFLGIPKVKVELIENPEVYLTNKFKTLFPYNNTDYGGRFDKYTSEKDLMTILDRLSEQCPFDLVIDMSNIFNLSIKEEQLLIEKKKLNLKTLFPTSQMVRFDNISSIYESSNSQVEFEKELLLFLKQQLTVNNDISIGYQENNSNDVFYKKSDLDESYQELKGIDEVCSVIKTLTLKK